MKPEVLSHHATILHNLSYLPRKILTLHGSENVPEFVLHDLCNKDCFNLTKAAFFVDNPDFNCLKGVAGFDSKETYESNDTIWDNPTEFSNHMKNSPFNKKVRDIALCSLKRDGASHEAIAQKLAHDFGMKNPVVHSWDMKHDNHGLFVYELDEIDGPQSKDYLLNGLCMFGFCPVF
jgi:hypothetical protein